MIQADTGIIKEHIGGGMFKFTREIHHQGGTSVGISFYKSLNGDILHETLWRKRPDNSTLEELRCYYPEVRVHHLEDFIP